MSLKVKALLGILLSYSSFEVYMHLRTSQIVKNRKEEFKRSVALGEYDIEKFRSTTVAGMFINPFDEYRPQTAFEFILVRIMEVFESFYGNKIEIHDKLKDKDGVEVEDFLKSHRPNIGLLRDNSIAFQSCIASGNFDLLRKKPSGGWFRSQLPPIRDQLIFTWLGQSCSLVQMSGINILTDPILGNHLYGSMGPKRLNKSPMTYDQIKYACNNKIQFILVSHDHPDHLEMDTVKKIGNGAVWIVPLGLKKRLARSGIYNTIEMDWWDTVKLNPYITNSENLKDNYEVVCVPAMHWSGRYILDANKSLWCSFIIRRNGESILYHVGDTGYLKELFKVIGKNYGPVQLSLLPIGQYCPEWHQRPRHISPQESLNICSDVSSRYMMGIHWGTFKLSSESILAPKFLFQNLAAGMNKTETYKVPDFGLTYLVNLQNDKLLEYEDQIIVE